MKRTIYFVSLLLAVLVLTTSCSTAKKTAINNLTEQTIPLSEARYRSDANYYRAVQSGKSTDISMAKKVAIQNSRQEIAASIKADLESVTENYAKNRQLPSAERAAFETSMTELTYTVVQQTLAGSVLVEEKMYTTNAGEYLYYVCMELNKEELKQAILDELKKKEKMMSDYELDEFKKTFEQKLSEYRQQ